MIMRRNQIDVRTQGNTHVLDVTEVVNEVLRSGAVREGIVNVCVIGSTAGITTTEFEPGLATHDLKAAFEGIASEDGEYLHERTWGDDNGHAHVRASLLGPSVTLPVAQGRLMLGQWQQVVLIDFDTRPRIRTLVVTTIGSGPIDP